MWTSTTARGGNAVDARCRNGSREKLLKEAASLPGIQIGEVICIAIDVRPKLFFGYAGRSFELQHPPRSGRFVRLKTLPNCALGDTDKSAGRTLAADCIDGFSKGG